MGDIELFLAHKEDNTELNEFYNNIWDGKYDKWILKYPEYIESIFLCLWRMSSHFDKERLELFLEKGMNINKRLNQYEKVSTFLHVACDRQDGEIIDLLLCHGANPVEDMVTSCIYGHAYGDAANTESILRCLNILEMHSIPLRMRKEHYDDLMKMKCFDSSKFKEFFERFEIYE